MKLEVYKCIMKFKIPSHFCNVLYLFFLTIKGNLILTDDVRQPSLPLNLETKGLKITFVPPSMAGQVRCKDKIVY